MWKAGIAEIRGSVKGEEKVGVYSGVYGARARECCCVCTAISALE